MLFAVWEVNAQWLFSEEKAREMSGLGRLVSSRVRVREQSRITFDWSIEIGSKPIRKPYLPKMDENGRKQKRSNLEPCRGEG